MVKELVVYPDDRIIMCSDVRYFDESVAKLFDDLKETMLHHNLPALSAMQVAHPFNMFVIKKGDEILEFANPRILKKEKPFIAPESTSYLPGVTVDVQRYEKLKIVYDDRDGNQKSMDIDGDREFAAMFQQMMDFSLGGSLLVRLSPQKREEVLATLAEGGYVKSEEVCPLFSKKDYFVSFTDKVLFFMGIGLLAPLFKASNETIAKIYTFEKIAFPLVIALMIGFFFYALYESKKYSQCTSCQIGNNIGVMIKRIVAGVIFAVGAFFILG